MAIRRLHARTPAAGIGCGVGAYLIWGMNPLYFHQLAGVSPVEVVACRTIFSLPLLLAIAAGAGQLGAVVGALRQPRVLLALTASAALIALNWGAYIVAVRSGHVLATSLGYYINPLLNVLIGTLFLGERLSRMRWLAVAIALVAVAILAWGAAQMLGIALLLASSFAFYGVIRKLVPVPALVGLAVETIVLAPLGLAWFAWAALFHEGTALDHDGTLSLLLAGTAVLTVVPLLLFGMAAQRLPLSTLGFIQYIAPTLAFMLGIFWFGEPLDTVQLVCFTLIWLAVGLFTADMVAAMGANRKGTAEGTTG